MSGREEFEVKAESGRWGACAAWALLLPDAAEGLLSEAEQSALDRHVSGCGGCARELADAQRGAAWLGLLKGHAPEPPLSLVASILARTTGSAESLTDTVLEGVSGEHLLPFSAYGLETNQGGARRNTGFAWIQQQFRRWFGTEGNFFPSLQPRLAMTSAMAFFSVCLTLNLVGFSVRSLHAEVLSPAGLQRTASDMGASLVRSFEGIRVVYRVESRVNEWRTANTAQDPGPLQGAQ